MSVSPLLFLRLYLPLALLLIGEAVLYGKQAIEHELTLLREQETVNVKLGAGALSAKLEFINGDLVFLSRHSALRDAINKPSPENLAHVEEDFAIFTGSRGHYDQIRWINQNGMEEVRVDYIEGKPSVVSAGKLQNKAERYYFTDTIKLNPGEVFISPLDLNIEQNKIEVPYKPMLRVATPVTDSQGKKRGIAILNYYGNDLLQAFVDTTTGIADHGMLINRDGYWLKSHNPSDEWGFMFKRPEQSLAMRSPAVWERIRSADNGQFELDDGLWTWATVYPLQTDQKTSTGTADAFAPSRGELERRQYFWKSVAHLPANTLSDIRHAIWLKVGWIVGLLLGLAGLGSWLLARAWTMLALERVKFRTVANFTYDWETWIDQNGHYLYCSPSCARVTGRSANEFMADPGLLINITHPDDQARMKEHLQQHEADDPPCELEVRILLPDGQVRWLEHSCQSVFSETGEFIGRRASNRDITAQKSTQERIAHLAHYDALTGLPNRILFYDRFRQALSMAKRNKGGLTLLYMDLDGFKKVNDTRGHHAGDLLLVRVAERLSKCVRESDTVARLGGDEFTIALNETHKHEDVVSIAQKIIAAISAPFDLDGIEAHIGISIGIARYSEEASDEDELMKRADQAMYEAKSAGKNTYRIGSDA